jgi:hypothetical protein
MACDMVGVEVVALPMQEATLERLEKILVAHKTSHRVVVDMDLLEQTASPPRRIQPVLGT